MTCRLCDRPRKSGRTLCHDCHLAERRVRERAANQRLNVARRERYKTDERYRLIIQSRNTLHFYGLTPCDFTRMRIEQGDTCAICGTGDPGKKKWHVDHDHSCCPTGRSCGKCVRALLCSKCNTGLGMFNDDPEALASAIRYLEAHSG